MDKVIKHGLQIAASFDANSQKTMRAALHKIFTEESHIDFNNPENVQALKSFAALFRDVFDLAGNKNFDFSKTMDLSDPIAMFNELKTAAKEFESVWSSVISQFGSGSLQNIFMKNQHELETALTRLSHKNGKIKQGSVNQIDKALNGQVKSKDLNYLMEEASAAKRVFISDGRWEKQTEAALKYYNIFHKIRELTHLDIMEAENKGMKMDIFKDAFDDLKNLGPYTMQQIESALPYMRTSLQNILNLSDGNPLIGLTEGGAIDVTVVPKIAKPLGVGDVTGGKDKIEVPVEFVVNPASQEEMIIEKQESAAAAEAESESAKKTTAELEKQQKILLYRRVEGKFDPSKVNNLSADALFGEKDGKIQNFIQRALYGGFAGFGDGLFAALPHAASDLIVSATKGQNSFFQFDASDYKFYINETVEQAKAIQGFLHSLQKLVGAGNMLDVSKLDNIEDLNEDQLFEKAQQIFQNFSMTKEEFNAWIERAQKESLAISKLLPKGKTINDHHNFGTRFMQSLGYDGILNQTGDIEYDGGYQGSVIFDPDIEKIKSSVTIFDTIDDLLKNIVENQKATWQDLINYISNSGETPDKFFDGILSDSKLLTEELKAILGALGLIEDNGINLNSITDGNVNKGGFVSDAYTLIARDKEYLPKAEDLIPKLAEAKKMGANVGVIFDVLKDETNDIIYELQQTVLGNPIEISGSTEFLQATEEQILKLIKDIEILRQVGLNIDFGGDNIFYDETAGFSFIDLATRSPEGQESVEGILQRFVANIKPGYEKDALFDGFMDKFNNAAGSSGYVIEQTKSEIAQVKNKIKSYEELCEIITKYNNLVIRGPLRNAQQNQEMKDIAAQLGLDSLDKDTLGEVQGRRGLLDTTKFAKILGIETAELATQNDELEENLKLKQMIDNIVNKGGATHGQSVADANGATSGPTVIDNTLKETPGNNAELKTAIETLTNAINTKMAAPDSDQDKAGIKAEDLKGILEAITYKVALTSDLPSPEEPPIQQNEGEIGQENGPWALENTLNGEIKTLLTNIKDNTTKKTGDGSKKQSTQSLTETLSGVKESLNKVAEVMANINTQQPPNDHPQDPPTPKEGKKPSIDVDSRLEKLSELKAMLKSTDNITEETDKQIKELFDSLNQVDDASGLAKWDKQFTEFSNKIQSLKPEYEKLGKLMAKRDTTPEYQRGKIDAEIKEIEERIAAKEKEIGINHRLYDTEEIEAYNAEYEKLMGKMVDDARKEDKRRSKQNFKLEVQKSRDAAQLTRAKSTGNSAQDILDRTKNVELTPEQIARLEEYRKALDTLNNTYQNLRYSEDGIINPEDAQRMKDQTAEVRRFNAEFKAMLKQYDDLSGDNVEVVGQNLLGKDADWKAMKQQLIEVALKATEGKGKIGAYNAETGELSVTVKKGAHEVENYVFKMRDLGGALVQVAQGTTRVSTPLELLGKKVKELSVYFTGSAMIYKAINEVKKGIQYVREIDSALTELKKVTDETEESYDKFLDTASKTASKVGSTISEIVNSTADWARLGYSMEEAAKLAESTSILLNVSEFDSIDNATSALVSTMQAFNYAAEDSMHVVDIMNEIGNNYAVSSDGIATALQESASALSAANNSYQEAVAMIAAANKTTQDVSKVGGALRTVSLRLRGTEVEGEDNEGLITSQSKLRGKIKSLSGVDILTDTGAYKSTYEILLEISRVFEKMNDMDQAALLEIIAGKNRSNVVAGLLSNTEDLEDAYQSAMDAGGSALKENEKYLDSIQGHIDQFTNAAQTMWSNELDGFWIKFVVDMGTEIVKLIDKIGVLPSLLGGVFIYLTAFKKNNPLDWIKSIGTYLSAIHKNGGVKQLLGQLLGIAPAMKMMTAETVANTIALQVNDAEKTKSILSSIGLTNSTQALSIAQRKQAIETLIANQSINGLTNAQIMAMAASFGLKTGIDATTGSVAILDTTTKSFMATNPVGWILAIVSAIMAVVMWISTWDSKTEKLTKKMSELSSEISDAKSKIDSFNSELKVTRDRIAELNAMPSLSFVEQEELNKLKERTAELERQILLQEEMAHNQQAEVISNAKTVIENEWGDKRLVDKKYQLNGVTGDIVIAEDTWGVAGVGAKEALSKGIRDFNANRQSILSAETLYLEALSEFNKTGELTDDMMGKIEQDLGFTQDSLYRDAYTDEDMLNYLKYAIDGRHQRLESMTSGINMVLGDMQKFIDDNNLSYSMGDSDINKFLDEYMAYSYAYKQAQGEFIQSDIAKFLFDNTSTDEMQALGKELQEIYDNENIVDKNQAILNKLGSLDGISDGVVEVDKLSDAYNRLKIVMEITGTTAQDIADHFILETGTYNLNTPEGIIAQYQTLKEVLENLRDNKIDINELVKYDEDTNTATALVDKIAEHLKGVGPQARKEFENVAEDIREGAIEFEDAIKKIELHGMQSVIGFAKTQLEEANKVAFPDLEFSGWIDSVEELKGAFDSLASSMDLIHTAQQQMNSSHRISLKTALDLMSATDQWNQILDVNNGVITMNANAEQILIQSKLELIKQNINLALEEVNTQIALMEGAINSTEAGNTFREGFTNALIECQGIMVGLKAGWDAFWSGGDVSKAFNDARNNTLKTLKPSQENLSALQQKKAELEKKKAMLEDVDTTQEFKNNYDFDKTPGDKYDDTGDALEALQKRYERKIKNIENQQTQIENEIERLEAEEQGISADYYEKQIDLENEKIGLYEQERAELLKLKRTDEVADALWEVEHAIQESTLRVIEFRKSIAELYATASEKISDAYGDLGKVYDDRKSYIENEISIRETKGELIPTSVYDDLIEQEEQKRANAEAELNDQADLYWQGINNGDFEADSKQAVAILETIRQKKLDIQESDKNIADYAEQQKDAYIAYFDAMMEAYSHRNEILQAQSDSAQSYIDRLETLNINVPDEAYKKMAEIQELNNKSLQEQAAFARGELENLKAQGIDENDSRYIEKFKEVLDLEQQVYEGETKILEYHQQIIDNHLDRFNQIIDRINHATSQLGNVASLVDGEDVAEEDGSWTKEGLTQLGMNYQQMEYNKGLIAEYTREMEYLQDQFDKGLISEKEYTEQMQELQNGQWEAINAYKSAEDAIVDLNEARIDMVEEGINKEIEAYQELIELKKEELDAERDLHDFRKDVQKQTKDIAALERRMASMSGSTDASTIAERTKLEAELREAREGLDDTYYSHAMDSKSNALDDELEAYEKSANSYIESLRESIKDTKLVVEQTFTEVLANANIVLSEINRLSGEYGFTIEPNLMNPWINAAAQATIFKNTADPSVRSLINEGGIITTFGSEETKNKLSGVFTAGSSAALNFKNDVDKHIFAVRVGVNSITSPEQKEYLGSKLKAPWDDAGNDANSGPLAFSKKSKDLMSGIVDYAETDYKEQLKNNLNYPWKQANGYTSWGNGVTTMLNGKVKEAEEAGKKIAEHLNVQTPSYTGNPGTTENPENPADSGSITYNFNAKILQGILNDVFGANIEEDGKFGPKSQEALKKVQEQIKNFLGSRGYRDLLTVNGKFDAKTRQNMSTYFDLMAPIAKSNDDFNAEKKYINAKKKLPNAFSVNMFAKGTLGTTRDQFAITDESWIGEEITLAAGKNGQLQYLKKGSAVMPADISANLIEWGQLDPSKMNIGDMSGGIQIMSNYVSKPELNLSFDSLVHVDHCDEGTLKDLEKMVDTKIDQFSKQMNYAIKRFK